MTLRFEHVTSTSVRIVDDIEHAQFEVCAGEQITPGQASEDRFRFPVDAAVAIEAMALTLPKLTGTVIRGAEGKTVAQSSNREGVWLPVGTYDIEVTTAPMKLYLAVESSLSVSYDGDETVISFGSMADVAIGARSFHERPAGTVTTTEDPETIMRAVTALGSALQTMSSERSFPTLRGHPPLLELGDEFSVPNGIEPPETGVTLVLPPDRAAVFAATPLAYYVGADVAPGCEARLEGTDWQHSLTASGDLETDVSRTLRQVFFLDCLTRTEGYYPVDLHERRTVCSALSLDFETLYDLPFAEQLGAYLDIPFSDLDPFLPEWNLTTDIRPTADNVEMLPFIARDLSLVRCPSNEPREPPRPEPKSVTDFFRADTTPEEGFVRGATSAHPSQTATRGVDEPSTEIVNPEPAETVEHAWVGEGYPLGASKATPVSYRRRLDRDAVERAGIDITVVCNNEEMREEDVVADLYGLRDLLQFDIEVHYDLTRDQLVQVLRTPTNFLHYIGHVDGRGIQCADDFLDVTRLDCDVAVESFLLNACQSYKQGEALIERGSYGGVVTLSEVANLAATEFGRTLARLLNCGFTLRSALSIAQEEVVVGYRYLVLGDGGMTLCHAESGGPTLAELEQCYEESRFDITLRTFPAPNYGLGTIVCPYIADNSAYYLTASSCKFTDLAAKEVEAFFDLETIPVRMDKKLFWSDEVTLAD